MTKDKQTMVTDEDIVIESAKQAKNKRKRVDPPSSRTKLLAEQVEAKKRKKDVYEEITFEYLTRKKNVARLERELESERRQLDVFRKRFPFLNRIHQTWDEEAIGWVKEGSEDEEFKALQREKQDNKEAFDEKKGRRLNNLRVKRTKRLTERREVEEYEEELEGKELFG